MEKQLNVKQTEERVERLLEEENQKRKAKQKAVSQRDANCGEHDSTIITMVANSGLNVNSAEEEFDEYYQITIEFRRKNNYVLEILPIERSLLLYFLVKARRSLK